MVYDIEPWDPDGAGPAAPVLVMCGQFVGAGPILDANRVVTFDPATGTWGTLGTGMTEAAGSDQILVSSLAVHANGDLIAGGTFTLAGGTPVDRIARWDGVSWQPLGTGVSGGPIGTGPRVNDLQVLSNGDLIVVGDFMFAGGVPVSSVARWDGATWWPVGSGVAGRFDCVTSRPNGDIFVSGLIGIGGGSWGANIARWDGTNWSSINPTPGGTNGFVNRLRVLQNGDLIAGGAFTVIDGVAANMVARWDGTSWHSMGMGGTTSPSVNVVEIAEEANGDIVIAGSFITTGPVPIINVARWNGTAWSPLGAGANNYVLCVQELANGDLIVGGGFSTVGGVLANCAARWNGASWSALAPHAGFFGRVNALLEWPSGEVVAGGNFSWVDGQPRSRLARWDGSAWLPLGTGVDASVQALASFQGGLYAGGLFSTAGGAPAMRIARWDGAVWGPVGTGILGQVNALAGAHNALYAGGAFTGAGGVAVSNVARWDGATWSALGTGTNNWVNALLPLRNGRLLAGGLFTSAGGVSANRIASWDGTSWQALGSGVNSPVNALLELPNGDVVVAGTFTVAGGIPASRIARWDGAAWSSFGSGLMNSVESLGLLPNGDLLAGGGFGTAGGAMMRVARWDGVSWSPVAGGATAAVNAILLTPDGSEVFVGGEFAGAGTTLSPFLARLQSSCPATTSVTGAGCPGSGGNNLLAAVTLPWAGSTLSIRGTGLPTPALIAAVTGFSPTSLPLALVLPQALPGCTLHATPDLVEVLVSVTGTADYGLVLPNSTAIVGIVLHQQMVALELDALLNLTVVTATNGLQHTLGFF